MTGESISVLFSSTMSTFWPGMTALFPGVRTTGFVGGSLAMFTKKLAVGVDHRPASSQSSAWARQ